LKKETEKLKDGTSNKNIIVNNITVQPTVRTNRDLAKWRRALKSAERSNQYRKPIYDLYEESLLDGHLTSIVEKRIEAITNTGLQFTDADGSVNPELTKMVNQVYFQGILEEIMNTRFWGYTLLQLDLPLPTQDIKQGHFYLVPRKHVKPRFKVVVNRPSDIHGINYTDPEWDDITLKVGKEENLGLLLQCTKYEILKSGNVSDWAEFAESFGVDPIIGKYNNEETRKALMEVISKRGAGGSMVAPKEADIDTLSGTNKAGSSTLFSKLREAMNDEMSVTILGQTMTTTDSGNAGYAQGAVHSKVEAAKYRADRRFVERVLNSQLTPYLEKIGWKVKDGSWKFVDEDHISLKDRITIDTQVSKLVPVDYEYFYNKYGIPKPETSETTKPAGSGKSDKPESDEEAEQKQRDFFS
jgi:phage gp29-like protein